MKIQDLKILSALKVLSDFKNLSDIKIRNPLISQVPLKSHDPLRPHDLVRFTINIVMCCDPLLPVSCSSVAQMQKKIFYMAAVKSGPKFDKIQSKTEKNVYSTKTKVSSSYPKTQIDCLMIKISRAPQLKNPSAKLN